MREKSKRLEADFGQVIQEIRNKYDLRDTLLEEYKNIPKEGNREIFVKRIMDMAQNNNLQREEVKNTVRDYDNINDQIGFYLIISFCGGHPLTPCPL